MIQKCHLDYIDKCNLVPGLGTICSVTCIFLKILGVASDSLKSHCYKEFLVTMIPLIGCIYVIYLKTRVCQNTSLNTNQAQLEHKKPFFSVPLPLSPVSSRCSSFSSCDSTLSSE